MAEKSLKTLEAAPDQIDNDEQTIDPAPDALAPSTTRASASVPYSAFTRSRKQVIVAIVALAGVASTLSANIYFPALNAIQEDFGTTAEMINLTISLYMVFQGLSPSLWGSLADQWGRRPVYLCTMVIYLGANVGLALSPNYTALLVLRMLQAFGSSSVIAIGAGCIGDIASPSERGTYFGIYSVGPMLGPIIGPIIGGVIAQNLGWRWIFWLLTIIAGALFFLVLFLLPETLRSLVGDGSGYANPTPTQWLQAKALRKDTPEPITPSGQKSRFLQPPKLLQPLQYIFYPDVAVCLFCNGIPYAVFYCVLSSTSYLFETIYGLNEQQIGLCYIANGVGCILGGLIIGRVLDRDFRITAEKHGYDSSKLSRGSLGADFPIFEARLRSIWVPLFLFDALIIIYGFLLWRDVSLAGILVVQFFLGICVTSLFNLYQTMLIDLFPKNSASITASNNLVRCLLGAACTAAIQPGITSIGVQYMFLTVGLIVVATTPGIFVMRKYGPRWRRNRMEQQAAALLTTSEKAATDITK
ncbi:hypothetical protein K450DRAFT_246532 [Umbelopsis ramanniana AG]|uniref:Major facilitator superfamily (MFS) profile domain-containing protein n=1 Tax=Umbelopsis ramanniana AG TaxID=1314678 RepID=A0AAD5E6W6_UMBRA|nr:uncharacterized protein K450DRAFT_246532 [Umbelopsis ramanniana AG]KAI8578578.1 hypothetical protein K450DRAFT_246532 [Umbelopsis ramanniana AG]